MSELMREQGKVANEVDYMGPTVKVDIDWWRDKVIRELTDIKQLAARQVELLEKLVEND